MPAAPSAATMSRNGPLFGIAASLRASSGEVRHVRRAVGVDDEQLLRDRVVAVGAAIAVALVDQELVIVERDDVADARARGQVVGEFLGVSARDVDRDDANGFVGRVGLAGVLDERRLHDADQRLAVRRDREAFHALVVGAAARVGARFDGALRGLQCDREIAGQSEGLDQLPGGAIELPHIRAVFVGDEDGLAVIGNANRFGIEARVRGHRGTAGPKIVGPAGEIKLVRRVLSRRPGPTPRPSAAFRR